MYIYRFRKLTLDINGVSILKKKINISAKRDFYFKFSDYVIFVGSYPEQGLFGLLKPTNITLDSSAKIFCVVFI